MEIYKNEHYAIYDTIHILQEVPEKIVSFNLPLGCSTNFIDKGQVVFGLKNYRHTNLDIANQLYWDFSVLDIRIIYCPLKPPSKIDIIKIKNQGYYNFKIANRDIITLPLIIGDWSIPYKSLDISPRIKQRSYFSLEFHFTPLTLKQPVDIKILLAGIRKILR